MTELRGEGTLSAGGRIIVSGTVGPAAEPKTTSMGLEIKKTFTIHESEPIDGAIQYELKIDGETVWVGMGEDRVDGLLNVIMRITDQEPEVPDN
jgi:hypothetical protein